MDTQERITSAMLREKIEEVYEHLFIEYSGDAVTASLLELIREGYEKGLRDILSAIGIQNPDLRDVIPEARMVVVKKVTGEINSFKSGALEKVIMELELKDGC